MYVESILRTKGDEVVAVAPSDTIAAATQILNEKGIGAVLVRDTSDEIIGIVSERDIVRGIARHKGSCLDMKVSDLMTSPVISCQPDDSVDKIMQLMTDRRIRHLPVMKDGDLLGIISIGDVVKRRISEIENETEALRQYISAG